MSDFVVYHNPDVMGYPALDVDRLAIYTNKRPGNVAGSRVWLLTGEGKPRKYKLRGTFVVAGVETSDRSEFETKVVGRAGELLDPMPVLNEEPWFPAFRKNHGNFAFGFQPIADAASVAGLKAVLKVSRSV